jgi:hypothetical protein
MPGDGGKWTWGVGGNGMLFGHDVGDNAEVAIAVDGPDGAWGQEPYAWERWARGREEDLREGRGSGQKDLWPTCELMDDGLSVYWNYW